MRVTLIRPAVVIPMIRVSANPLSIIPPLGLAYLAASLRSAGHHVTCIDASGEAPRKITPLPVDSRLLEIGLDFDETIARIPADSDVIGISCMFSAEWFWNRELVRRIRANFPGRFVVLGGEHVTAEYEHILKTDPGIDACVLGEGEAKFAALVGALEKGEPKSSLPGIAFWDPAVGAVKRNDLERADYRIQDINTIPWPAWDLLPLRNYIDTRCGFSSYGHRSIPMLASRGCPYQCTFCSSPTMWTTRWKARDIDDLLAEIRHYKKLYGINRVEFYDLTTIVDKNWISEFSRRLIDEKVEITWASPAGTRSEALTAEVLPLIKKSGCDKLTYALESSSKKTSERIKKRISHARMFASIRNAVDAGIIVKVNMILGFPFHTYGDIVREIVSTVRLAWLGVNDLSFYNFTPYPGSELHRELVQNGVIVKDGNYTETMRGFFPGLYTARSWNPRIPSWLLNASCVLGMGAFYVAQFLFRPHRVFLGFKRLVTKRPITMIELATFNFINRLTFVK